MMKVARFVTVAALFVSVLAFAQQPQQPQQPPPQRDPGRQRPRPPTQQERQAADPCKRGDTQVQFSGIDPDESRCYEAVLQNVLDNLGQQLTAELGKEAKMTAKQTLMEQDRDAARAQLENVTRELDWYKDYYNSVEPELEKQAKQAQAKETTP